MVTLNKVLESKILVGGRWGGGRGRTPRLKKTFIKPTVKHGYIITGIHGIK